MTRRGPLAAALAAALLAAGCASRDAGEPIAFEAPETAVDYEAELSGAPSEEIAELMRESLALFRRQEDGAQSVAFLRQRGRGDQETITKILRSFGYYEGTAEIAIDAEPPEEIPEDAAPLPGERRVGLMAQVGDRPDGEEGEPRARAVARVVIEPGPQFTLASHRLDLQGAGERALPDLSADALGSPVGEAAEAGPILAAEQTVVDRLKRRFGRPYARFLRRDAVADLEANTIEVVSTFDAGAYYVYGDVQVEGTEDVDPAYILTYEQFDEGGRYNTDELAEYQRELRRTSLFETVSVRPPEEPAEGDALPVIVSIVEGPPRTIGAGARWSTDTGFSGRLRYEHRNLFGSNETLSFQGTAGVEEQRAELRYRVPQWLRDGQDFVSGFGVRNLENDAFSETAATLTAGVEREIDQNWTAGLGGLLEVLETGDDDQSFTRYRLAGLPFFARYDGTDDELDPKRGHKLHVAGTPYVGRDENDTALAFTPIDGGASIYQAIDSEERYVLAARGRYGFTLVDDLTTVPRSKRLYSGGGGSVRGYGERSIGPLDEDDDPTGGLSVLELSGEFRARFGEAIGAAAFVDAGAVGQKTFPTFDEGVQVGAGVGLRYFSPAGPIRVDLAFPLDRREDVDDPFQLYISVGQAF